MLYSPALEASTTLARAHDVNRWCIASMVSMASTRSLRWMSSLVGFRRLSLMKASRHCMISCLNRDMSVVVTVTVAWWYGILALASGRVALIEGPPPLGAALPTSADEEVLVHCPPGDEQVSIRILDGTGKVYRYVYNAKCSWIITVA